jgi:hypothetical protein
LSGKNITGTMPLEIGFVRKLQIQLNLSCNSLEGKILSTLSGLYMLEILDLSNNKLTGEVSGYLKVVLSLKLLNLSNNRLTGILPNFRKGLLINDTCNPGLCTGQCVPATATTEKKRISVNLLIGVSTTSVVFFIGTVALFIVECK